MFIDISLNNLFELNLICAECEYRYDVYCCNNCSTLHKIFAIRKELDKHDVDDVEVL